MKRYPAPVLLLIVLVGAFLGGCTSPETASAAPLKKSAPPKASAAPPSPVAAVVAPKPAPAIKPAPAAMSAAPSSSARTAPRLPDPALRPEVTATVDRLTRDGRNGTLEHESVDTTGFPEAMSSLAPGANAPKTEVIYLGQQPPVRGLTADGNSTALVEKDWTGLVLVPINTALSKAYTTAVRLLKVEAHPLSDGRIRVWIRVKNIEDKSLPTEIACAFRMEGDKPGESPYFYDLEVPGLTYRDVFFVSPAGQLDSYTVLVRPRIVY